jgi:hypothetical protein
MRRGSEKCVYNDSSDSIVLFTNEMLKSTIYKMVLSAIAALFNETFMTCLHIFQRLIPIRRSFYGQQATKTNQWSKTAE